MLRNEKNWQELPSALTRQQMNYNFSSLSQMCYIVLTICAIGANAKKQWDILLRYSDKTKSIV